MSNIDDWTVVDDWAQPGQEAENPSVLSKALEPITSYPETYMQMNREAREQIGRGVEQLSNPSGAWDVAKGAGNVALGGLGYVTSPISAGLRTIVGKPIEEATGIPKEYSEFAASLALPGIGMTRVPAVSSSSKAQQVAEASDRLGVSIPRAAASERPSTQATAGVLKEVPIVGSPLVKASRKSLQEMDQAVDRTVSGYGSGQPLSAGQAAIEGIEGWIGGKSADVARRLYDTVDNAVNPTFTRHLHATEKVLADIMARRANAKISGTSRAVDEVQEAVVSQGMNYQGLKDLRSYIGEMTPDEMIAKGISKSEAKRIYGALTEDLRSTVLNGGGPDALRSFDRANNLYEAIADKRRALAKIIGTRADVNPERALARIIEMANSKGGANYLGLVQARRAIGPEKWDEITSAIVNKMGRLKPGDEFSSDRFKTAWEAMPDASRRVVFNSTNKPGLAQSIDDIVTLSNAHKSLAKFGNPSGTGKSVSATGLVAGAWAEPMSAIGSAVGGHLMARVLASPIAAKQASKWALVYSNAAKNPSPARMAVLSTTSENLANALGREFGARLNGMDFMKGIQGPIPARGDDGNE